MQASTLSITFMILKDKHPYNIVKNVNKKDLKYINPSSIFGFVVASCFSLELEERNVSSKDSGRDNWIPSYTHYSYS